MAFLPALCGACSRVQLLSLTNATHGELECAFCDGEVRVVPGCSYGESERRAFNEMSDIVAEAQVSPSEALLLAQKLTSSISPGGWGRVLEQLCERMPGLVSVQQAVGQNTAAQRRAVALLKTILDALSTARRVSSTYAVAEAMPRLATKA